MVTSIHWAATPLVWNRPYHKYLVSEKLSINTFSVRLLLLVKVAFGAFFLTREGTQAFLWHGSSSELKFQLPKKWNHSKFKPKKIDLPKIWTPKIGMPQEQTTRKWVLRFNFSVTISFTYFIVIMQNICNLIGWNSVHIFDIFNHYREISMECEMQKS